MRRSDRGSATAEMAVALPALVMLLLAGLSAVSAVTTHLRCVAVARDAVLAASRGESRSAPEGFAVSLSVDGDVVHARVRAPVRPLGGILPELAVSADAVAALEPGETVG